MRKYIFFVTFASLLALSSCTGEKPKASQVVQESSVGQPRYEVSAEDSAEVVKMTREFLDNLKDERYDEAVGMLRVFDGDTLSFLSGGRAATQKAIFKRFHGIRYQLTSLRFLTETDNLITYTVTLFDNAPGEKHTNTVRGALNPIRIGGDWYLTLVDSKTEPKGGSEIHN